MIHIQINKSCVPYVFRNGLRTKKKLKTKLQELANKFEPGQWSDLDEAARKRRTEHAENLAHFQSFLKGPVYTCKIPNCGKELCEPCLNKMEKQQPMMVKIWLIQLLLSVLFVGNPIGKYKWMVFYFMSNLKLIKKWEYLKRIISDKRQMNL